MAAVHLCNIDTNHITASKIAELLEGKRRQTNAFKCGRCSKTFTTICVLHYHCMIHCKGGSYFFDHTTRTAFPRYDTVCSYSQVETDLLEIELGKDLIEGERTLTSTAREINTAIEGITEAQNVTQGNELYLDIIKDSKKQVTNIDGGSYLVAELRKENRENGSESLNTEPTNKECVIDNNSGVTEESSMHTLNQEQVSSNSFVANAGNYGTGQVTDTNTMEVKIRNISQSEDGMISFDIDEKYSDLFEVAASTILERIQREGFEWIDGNAVKITVPVKGSSRSNTEKDTTCKDTDNNSKNGINDILADVGTFAQNSNLGTEQDEGVENDFAASHADVKEYPYIKKAKVTKKKKEEKGNKDADLDEWLENVLNINNETSASVSKHGTKREVKKNVEMDASSNKSRRSGRRRIVSSRLKDAIWDSPVKQKDLPKDTKRNRTKTRLIEDVKEEVGENEQKNEMQDRLEEKIDGSQCNVTEKPHFSVSNSQLSELDLDVVCDNVEADQTCEADITASEVLLSLSKANKQDSLNRNSTEQGPESQMSKSVNGMRTRSKTSSRSKLSDDAVDSADDTSDWEKPKRSKKSKVPATKRKDHKCETCGKVGSLQMVRYHKQCHSEHKSFFCEVCGKGYKTKPCLVAHKRQHDEYKFKCDKCPASFYRKQFLRSHLLTHTGELPHVCDICNKGFRELYILQRHVNNVHKNIRNFLCDICGMRFFRQETRDNHRVRHFEPTIPCRYCPKMFKAELDRRKHELTHTGEKQFFCPKCSNGFTQLWPYYRHMWKKHNIGKEEAKKIKIRNKDIVSMKNIHRPDPEPGIIQIVDMKPCPDTVVVEHVYEEMESDEYQESASVVYETKMIQELPEDSVVEYKEPVVIQKEGYMSQSNEEFVTQSGNEIVTQSANEMVIQSTSQGAPVAADLKAIYDHFYVDGSNIVLSGNQEKRTVVMRTRQEDPETGDISIVQQNFVILSEYPAMDGTPLEIEGYKKIEDYSELDIS